MLDSKFETEAKAILVKAGYCKYDGDLWIATDGSDEPENWKDILLYLLVEETMPL